MDISLPEDKIKYLEGQTQSLQFQLAQRCALTSSTQSKYEEMKQELLEMNNRLEQQSSTTSALTKDMTRQYKGMQDDLLAKIAARDVLVQNLTDELSQEVEGRKKALEEKDCVIREKDECIKRLERKAEEQCGVFAKMLERALELMKEGIEVQVQNNNNNSNNHNNNSNNNSDEKSVPIQQRLEEFKFNPNPVGRQQQVPLSSSS